MGIFHVALSAPVQTQPSTTAADGSTSGGRTSGSFEVDSGTLSIGPTLNFHWVEGNGSAGVFNMPLDAPSQTAISNCLKNALNTQLGVPLANITITLG